MSFEQWLAFAAASAVLLAIPGPTILLVISYALGHGRRAAGATVGGVALGDFTAMTASMLGLGALLATSATLFTALKWIGAAYLIWLGVKLWRAPVRVGADAGAVPQERPVRIFLHAYIVTALNPKSIIFFVAFLPQFLNTAQPMLPQMIVFEATFLVLAILNVGFYALMAGMARNSIRKPGVQRVVNRVGGSLMIGAGAMAAGWKRASA
ncbi:LysE family translocator [Sinirhodobacter populi]|uniref:LysE family translocator n=2 Tax=Paenirhodobacter populi TaxID=2306993 RepID=A0A443KH50_9RHOB|nr:LysE family translocator [Sinirhodobacter populi]RWR32091.1 LysE family translocator [Sinirhodobacter populi]